MDGRLVSRSTGTCALVLRRWHGHVTVTAHEGWLFRLFPHTWLMRSLYTPTLRYWSDAFFNLAGVVGPGVIAVAAIPVLLSSLTTSDFATLSLQLAVLTVVGINDIGLSRSLILIGADGSARSNDRSYTILLRVGVRLALYLAGIVAFLGAAVIVLIHFLSLRYQPISTGYSWGILIASIVLSLPGGSLRAGLELRQRFGAVAATRLIGNSLMYALPAGAAYYWHSLLAASLALLASRAIYLLLVALPHRPMLVRENALDLHVESYTQRQLIRRGWWIGLTGVLSNLIAYMDRFALGIWAGAAATASYAVASDLLTKQWLVTGSLLTVGTPRVAASWTRGESGQSRRSFRLLTLSILAIALACHLVISFAGRPLLRLWLGARFTQDIYNVAAIMSLGMAFNAISASHFLLINVSKRDSHGAYLQVASLAIFFAATAAAAAMGGAVAVAAVFAARLAIDALVVRSMVPDHPDGATIGLSYKQLLGWFGAVVAISIAGRLYSVGV